MDDLWSKLFEDSYANGEGCVALTMDPQLVQPVDIEEENRESEEENRTRQGFEDMLYSQDNQHSSQLHDLEVDESSFWNNFMSEVNNCSGNQDASGTQVPRQSQGNNVRKFAETQNIGLKPTQMKRKGRQSGGAAILSNQLDSLISNSNRALDILISDITVNTQSSTSVSVAAAISVVNRMLTDVADQKRRKRASIQDEPIEGKGICVDEVAESVDQKHDSEAGSPKLRVYLIGDPSNGALLDWAQVWKLSIPPKIRSRCLLATACWSNVSNVLSEANIGFANCIPRSVEEIKIDDKEIAPANAAITNCWTKPPLGYFKINVDVANNKNPKCFILRNHEGSFVVAKMERWFDLYHPKERKQGITKALKWLKKLGVDSALTESDALLVVKGIQSSCGESSFDLVIEDVRKLAKDFSSISFMFVN
nr:Myb/SANT-like DNA-binding domain protein [Ipomoea batatas]